MRRRNRKPLMVLHFLVLWIGGCGRTAPGAVQELPPLPEIPPQAEGSALPPPLVFRLAGLTKLQEQRLRRAPGVQSVQDLDAHWLGVVWQPIVFSQGECRLVEGADRFCRCVVVQDRSGDTEWKRGQIGGSTRHSDIVVGPDCGRLEFRVFFKDGRTGRREEIIVRCYSAAKPGQVEHEMLRYFAGTRVSVEKCGNGYAIVSVAGRGTMTAWQISNQMFAVVYDSLDREAVGAYIDRLGSVTPPDYQVDVDRWIVNEIRWRLMKVNDWDGRKSGHGAGSILQRHPIWLFFPDVRRIKGAVDFKTLTPNGIWEYMKWTREFLWANRHNFRYDDRTRGYILKGPDRYDPANPPELPRELRQGPRPDENGEADRTE